jgi:uncharacterized membrane protein YphA (DoxX/SURF4 family)
LGALIVYMGLRKALDPVDFLKLLRQYNMVDSSLALNAIALGLPWFEVFCGLLLLAGIAVRGTALLLTLMLVTFTCIVFRRALGIHALQHIAFCAIKFDCGCGGGEVFICRKMIENLGLILLSAWILVGQKTLTTDGRR